MRSGWARGLVSTVCLLCILSSLFHLFLHAFISFSSLSFLSTLSFLSLHAFLILLSLSPRLLFTRSLSIALVVRREHQYACPLCWTIVVCADCGRDRGRVRR